MATNLDTALKELCKREENSGCYDMEVDGIRVYSFIRFHIRNFYLSANNMHFVESSDAVNYWHYIKSLFLSSLGLARILLLRKKFRVLFYPFLRLDCADGVYMDKFTDPVIECCGLRDDYLIFDRGRRGEHPAPRLHRKDVVYTNILDLYCAVYVHFMFKRLYKRHRNELERLFCAIDQAVEQINYDHHFVAERVFRTLCYIRLYDWVLNIMQVRKIFAPSRANILELTHVAKKNGIKVYEFQHGITYGETALYSGYRDPQCVPDFFLAYGDTPPRDVYGIEESKIINIGWAFQDYLEMLSVGREKPEKSVLVISNPCTTDKVLRATFYLADAFKDWQFVVRPHPVEVVTQEHIKAISEHENVSLQDWHINVALSMQSFDHIIGESSTVLYEALNDGKKVARFCFEGFTPEYLNSEDEDCFWKVKDTESFKAFIDGKLEDKKSMKIYTKFNKELFMELYNS